MNSKRILALFICFTLLISLLGIEANVVAQEVPSEQLEHVLEEPAQSPLPTESGSVVTDEAPLTEGAQNLSAGAENPIISEPEISTSLDGDMEVGIDTGVAETAEDQAGNSQISELENLLSTDLKAPKGTEAEEEQESFDVSETDDLLSSGPETPLTNESLESAEQEANPLADTASSESSNADEFTEEEHKTFDATGSEELQSSNPETALTDESLGLVGEEAEPLVDTVSSESSNADESTKEGCEPLDAAKPEKLLLSNSETSLDIVDMRSCE